MEGQVPGGSPLPVLNPSPDQDLDRDLGRDLDSDLDRNLDRELDSDLDRNLDWNLDRDLDWDLDSGSGLGIPLFWGNFKFAVATSYSLLTSD